MSDAAERFAVGGLVVASELALPEWAGHRTAHDRAHDPDVRITVDAAAGAYRPGRRTEWLADGDGLHLWFEGVGTYRVHGGRTIAVSAAPGADAAAVRMHTLGTAWAAVLYQRMLRGLRAPLLLHASAVEIGGAALLVFGPSGAGKSTLAAALVARGARLIADDQSLVELTGDGAAVWPGPPRIRLRRDAFDLVDLDAFSHRQVRCTDKVELAVARSDAVSDAPVPIGALLGLDVGERRLVRLRGARAVVALGSGATYRPELFTVMNGRDELWECFLRLARVTTVHRLVRPWGDHGAAVAMASLQPEPAGGPVLPSSP